MVKVYKMENLECANCAAKMERAIAKLDGVNACSISFMTQKLTLDVDEAKLDAVLSDALKICRRLEKHVNILAK